VGDRSAGQSRREVMRNAVLKRRSSTLDAEPGRPVFLAWACAG
jgi:hypothetical protein